MSCTPLRAASFPSATLSLPATCFPVGLYLSDPAARELDAAPRYLESFRRHLTANGLFVRMVNAFPFGEFHAARVKTAAYHPDWRSPIRLDYTRRCARILAALMSEGASGSVTTVPGGWAPDWTEPPADTRAALANVRAAAETCRDLYEETGRTVRIALEPEPGCVWNLADPAVEDALPPEIGWCLDTCHAAVDGVPLPEPGDSLWRCNYRVQLSAALEAPNTPEARTSLLPFAEPAYLHQTRGRRITAWDDLSDALDDLPRFPADAIIHSHFHVPLDWSGTAPLRTTRDTLTSDFLRAASRVPCEVETYTRSVLPPAARPAIPSLPAAIASELSWTLPRLIQTPDCPPVP